MGEEKYVIRQPNLNPNDVKRWDEEKNNITAIPIGLAEQMQNTFKQVAEISKEEENDFQKVQEANKMVRDLRLKRVKKLEDEKRAGYIAISSLTIIGTLLVGAIIFIIVGNILG